MSTGLIVEGNTVTYQNLFTSTIETEVTAIDVQYVPGKVTIRGKGASVIIAYCIRNVDVLKKLVNKFKSGNNYYSDNQNIHYQNSNDMKNDKILIETARYLLKTNKLEETISFILEYEKKFNPSVIVAVKEAKKMLNNGEKENGVELLRSVLSE